MDHEARLVVHRMSPGALERAPSWPAEPRAQAPATVTSQLASQAQAPAREIEPSVEPSYTRDQYKLYLNMMERVATKWTLAFQDNDTYYATELWDLFTKLWKAGGVAKKRDAFRFMRGYRGERSAERLILQAALDGYLVYDKKQGTVAMTEELKQRLEDFFDTAVDELMRSSELIGASAAAGPRRVHGS